MLCHMAWGFYFLMKYYITRAHLDNQHMITCAESDVTCRAVTGWDRWRWSLYWDDLYRNTVFILRLGPGITRARFNIKTDFIGMGIPMLKIRRSWDRIFNMRIPILVRHLYIETASSLGWLTHWEWQSFAKTFSNAFYLLKIVISDIGSNWQNINIDFGNGLVPNRCQTIIRTNDILGY